MIPTRLEPCDLVLKGGVTSAVVYLGSLIELGRAYRFHSIGGTSSGAIAAALAAAAEYRRQTAGTDGLAAALGGVGEELTTHGFQAGIFQAGRRMRPIMRIVQGATRGHQSPARRALSVLAVVVRSYWWAVAAIVGTTAVVAWLADPDGVAGFALAAVAVLLACCVATLIAAGLLALRVKRFLDDPEHGFGVFDGLTQDGAQFSGVTDWLHKAIQRAAGRDDADAPLTFAELREHEIDLQLVSTNLSTGMPLTWPLVEHGAYRFDVVELARVFPRDVVAHLTHGHEPDAAGLYALPVDRLPVLFGVRLSLAFPVLISCVPLHAADGTRHWFSDGGTCSNFPVHLFDTWTPERPTFGLDIRPAPSNSNPAKRLVTLGGDADTATRWTEVGDVTTFLRQVADAAQNWRDSAQAALPGYRNRICRIDLLPGEGGVNINMDVATIERLIDRGGEAAAEIIEHFRWEPHRLQRHALLMRLLQRHLQEARPPFDVLEQDVRDAVEALLAVAADWGPPPLPLDFNPPPEPHPPAGMRIVPRW